MNEPVEGTWVTVHTADRLLAQEIADELHRLHGGRRSFSRGIRHIVKVYRRLDESMRKAAIAADNET